MVIHIYLVLIPIFLVIAAIFAATEASLFSLSRTQLEILKREKPSLFKSIRQLIQRPDALLSTIIIGNECISVLNGTFVVTLLTLYFPHLSDNYILLFSIMIGSVLSLIFSEVLPKIIAFRLPVITASILVYPASWAHFLFSPFRYIFLGLSKQILRLLPLQNREGSALSEKDLLTLIEVGAETGSLDSEETQLIQNVFTFSDKPISSVMTPWKDVFTIPDTLAIPQILESVRKQTYSRIPVVSGDRNEVVGILYTKQLLKLLLSESQEPEGDVKEAAIFPPYIVSSHKKVSRLFREFKAKKIHMALVVDEYGRHSGVVTLEDLLNALFKTQHKPEVDKK